MTTDTTLASLVAANPSAALVLEQHGLDYCCGGHQSLADACRSLSIDPTGVLSEIQEAATNTRPEWTGLGLADLVDHVVDTHHAFLHREMPRLVELASKVSGVHGVNHPELHEIERVFRTLVADLTPHLMKEERVLFPMIHQLVAGENSFHCGTLQNPIRQMLTEHDTAGVLLKQLNELSGGYAPPDDACGSYTALYSGLAELEADVHMHIHIENNLLFPDVIALECERT